MEHLLFVAYLGLFAWLVTKVNFFRRSGLTPPELIIVFLLKVIAGVFYGWVGVYYGEMARMVDTWYYHYESMQEMRLLINDPIEFVTSLFRSGYESGYSDFLGSTNSWWNDLDLNIFIKTLAVFDLFSGGNYYINLVFYSFLTIYGPIAVYRVMQDVYPSQKTELLIATFLVPSFLYWTSGIHKEGYIFTGLALVIYNLYFGLKQKINWYRWVNILAGLLIILVLRNFLLIVLLPALFAWVLAQKLSFKPLAVFTAAYILFIALFFTAKYIHPKLNFPEAVVAKQQAFLQLRGGSFVPTTKLEPTFKSFVTQIPEALTLTIIRPYPSDAKHLLSLAAVVEINLLLLCFIFFLLKRNRQKEERPFLLFCLFFSFSVLLIIGYTVNFLGAIVRYRSIVLPFIIIPVVASVNWKELANSASKYINYKYNT